MSTKSQKAQKNSMPSRGSYSYCFPAFPSDYTYSLLGEFSMTQ